MNRPAQKIKISENAGLSLLGTSYEFSNTKFFLEFFAILDLCLKFGITNQRKNVAGYCTRYLLTMRHSLTPLLPRVGEIRSIFISFILTRSSNWQNTTEFPIILHGLSKKTGKVTDDEPRKVLSDFHMDNLENVNAFEEFIQVLGEATWDIFSDNHEVIAEDGNIYDLGSFRATGSTIADFINEYYPLSEGKLDYLDFYMGSIWMSNRASMLPFYKYIFTVLKQYNCNWRYSFPKLGLVSFNKEEPEHNNPAEYSPLQAMREELAEEKSEVNKLQEELNEIFDQDYENAKYEPLPLIVLAYKEVYGILPEGHPQKEFE